MASKTDSVFTILGCGTSTGVPRLGCQCRVCRSKNPKNKRLRAAAWIRTPRASLLIDTSTDLRQQALTHRISRVDAVLYTHPHADHIHGIDDLRSFNFIQNESIPLYGNEWTAHELEERFAYVFGRGGIYEGGGRPKLEMRRINSNKKDHVFKDVKIQPIPMVHGSQECLAYRIGSVAYATDCSYIPPKSLDRLKGLSVLVLDCLQLAPHRTHLNLEQALEIVSQVKPRRTVFTHLGHDFDYAAWSRKLPKGTELAYDGMKIRFNAGE